MKKSKIMSTIISYAIIIILMILKTIIMKNYSIPYLVSSNLIIFFMITLANINMKNNKKIRLNYNLLTIGLLLLGCIFKGFDSFTFIMLYFFIIIITNATMALTKYRFEISIIGSIFILIILYIILGLLDILKYSRLYLLIITITSLIYLFKNKKKFENNIDNKNVTMLTIFTVLFFIAVLGGVERYVHSWDEYSYWAYAAKVCINEKSLLSVIERLGNTRNYPPVSTVWHYIVSSFSNGFSEPNLYIGLTILTFISFMPVFSNIIDKQKKYTSLFVVAVLAFPLLFSGAYSYSLIYVDLLLASLCTTTIILFEMYRTNEINKRLYIMPIILMTLLKPNGFVFAFTLLLLFYLRDLTTQDFKLKNIFKEMKKYIIPGIIVVVLFGCWTLLTNTSLIASKSYDYTLMPASLKANLGPKLKPKFILDFANALLKSFDKVVIFGNIKITLYVFLLLTFSLIFITEEDKKKKNIISLLPYIISYIVFFLVTALSIFVMFSKYEAENLASFERYLAPINIAFFIFALHRLINTDKDKVIKVVLLVIIGLVNFQSLTFFATDIRERRDTKHIRNARIEGFKDVINKTEEDAKVFVINQEDIDSIMPLWYARYYCYPRTINSSSTAITWKIKTKDNTWDLKKWGLTDRKLEKHLIEYDFDYIYFYSQTDELEKELDEFVDDADDYDRGRLFKIVKEDTDNLKFELVK